MSSGSKSSLDHDWELATARTSSPTHLTVTSDDELETISLPADPSELGDDTWEGIDDDNESLTSPMEATDQAAKHELTPLQSHQGLSADADDAEAAESDLSQSEVVPSENSGTDSTFSFHFPDPLEASREYATYPEAPVNGSELGESDAESNSIAETDAVAPVLGINMSIGALERSATLVQPRSSGNSAPLVATSISSRFAFAAGIALTAVAIACVAIPGVYRTGVPLGSDRINTVVSTALAAKPLGVHVEPSLSVLATVSPDSRVQSLKKLSNTPTLSNFKDLRSVEPSSPPPRSIAAPPSTTALVLHHNTSLSLNPISLVASSLSMTYNSFSKVVLRDLRDVLQIIDELLLFLRSHTLADTVEYSSRSIVDFIMQKLGNRHERAKVNARKLTNKGIELVREWRQRR